MSIDPFHNSRSLSEWGSKVLLQRGIQEIAKWRMLEYWIQVELYRAAESGLAGTWRHLGEYEQPYHTDLPRSGSKYNINWVDLVLAEPTLSAPNRVVWVELRDVGRSNRTLQANLKGVGEDLAALSGLDPGKTKEIWTNPPPHAVDKGRLQEWHVYAPSLDTKNHLIAQIVIVPRFMVAEVGGEFISHTWLESFQKRANVQFAKDKASVAQTDGSEFSVFALVAPLPAGG